MAPKSYIYKVYSTLTLLSALKMQYFEAYLTAYNREFGLSKLLTYNDKFIKNNNYEL